MSLDREAGAGSLLGLAVMASIMMLVALLVPLFTGLGLRQAVGQAADASALAAADVAVGLAPGYPCAAARATANADGATLMGCTVDGLVVTVSAERSFLGIRLAAISTAGPPGVVTN
jgi:secretion/DNA translocation related TadE-like protein